MKRNKFSLSNYKLATFGLGQLIPVGLNEVIPGDTFDHTTSTLMRFSPLLAPVMHPIDIRVHHWFVPLRIIWDEFEDFITGGSDGTKRPEIPTIKSEVEKYSLHDYLGLPVTQQEITFSALPLRAFNLIYNEYYRDQDLIGPRDLENTFVPRIAWSKDYFTSARPWPQKGPAVTVPLGQFAPVISDGSPGFSVVRTSNPLEDPRGVLLKTDGTLGFVNSPAISAQEQAAITIGADGKSGLVADLREAGGATVLDVREAFALQRYAEARARYGSRYTEYLRYLGVRSSDARLQRPEYLGGGKQTVSISEVLQTAEGTDPVGTMRGHGISAMRSRPYRKFFEEHGYVISMMSVLPRAMYMDATPRHFLKRVREDYWQRELQHIGQQEIWNGEVYPRANDTQTYGTFGYQDRYAEYRHQYSSVAGDFRDTLNYWHMARSFTEAPVLNASFIRCNPGRRNFADQTSDQLLWTMVNHRLRARRMVARNASGRIL